MKLKRTTKLIAVLLILLAVISPASVFGAATDIDLEYDCYSNAAYLVEMNTGRLIYEKNSEDKVYPASTTKIMTAALALELCPDPANTYVTVPADIWVEFEGINISSIGLIGGETMSMLDLVYAMLLASANEAASTVAAYFGRDEFISKMNQKALELGCTGTHFSNPHGLYSADHYTTAKDLYKITEWALGVKDFFEICSQYSYTIAATDKSYARDIVSTNYLMNPYSNYYTEYVKGVKTGTIEESGRCLVSTAEKDGLRFCLVLMGAPTETTDLVWTNGNAVFNETRYLYDLAFDVCSIAPVTDTNTAVTSIPVKYAAKRDSMILYCSSEINTVVDQHSEEPADIRFVPEIPEFVAAPIHVGDVIGTATVYADDIEIGRVDLVSRETIELSRFSKVMDILAEVFTSKPAMIIGAVVFIIAIIYVYYIIVVYLRNSRKKKKKQNNAR